MKTCQLLFWCQTKYDARDTASSTGCLRIPQMYAYQTAKEIEFFGQSAIDEAIAKYGAEIVGDMKNCRAASGHGVTVVYPSGKIRNVGR